MVLIGRLGLETARIPHVDRHGLMWLSRGHLVVQDGTLHFIAAPSAEMASGDYAIPFQNVSLILIGPGTTVSHDALRILARHGTGLVAVGEDGVRLYSAPPLGTEDSKYARRQAILWAVEAERVKVAKKMYAWRLGESLPQGDIAALRGVEGARMKETYLLLARKYGVEWCGRRYDRQNPESADPPNQAINHAATAVEAAATIAIAATGTIPSLGFIHEDSANAFCLDIADLFRDSITIPVAFEATKLWEKQRDLTIDRHVRRLAGQRFRQLELIPKMIDRIKELLSVDDRGCNSGCG